MFDRLDEPTTPLTTAEVAEELGCPETTADRHLTDLDESGAIESKRVGESHRVWWRPEGRGTDRERAESREFAVFVSAVEDYAIFTLDPDGTVASWNEGAERIKGYAADEIVGEHVSTFYTDADREKGVPEANLATAAIEGRIEDEGWRVRADGSRFWANVVITAVRDDEGALRGFTKVTRDMTERREYEWRLRREHDQTEQLLQTAPIPIAVQNADRETILANERAQEAFGLSEQEFRRDLVDDGEWTVCDADGDPLPPDETPSARAIESGEPVTDQTIVVRPPDGEPMQFRVNAAPLFDADGEVERVVTAGEEVTELKRRERQLKRQKSELQTELGEILGRISDAFFAVDEEWRFTHLNDSAAEIVQQSREELLGRSIWEVFPGEGVYRERFEAAMADQEPVTFEAYDDGLEAWLEFNAYPSETGLSVYFRDVTDRIERERDLQRTERRFEAIFEDPNILVGLLDPDGTVLDINETAMEYIDADLGDVRGEPFWETPWWGVDAVDGSERADGSRASADERSESSGVPDDVREWTERAAAGEYVDFEADLTRPDGERYVLSGYFRPVRDDDGEVVSIIVSDRDVTERREYERSLQRYKEYTDDVLDAVDDVFYLLDESGAIQRWNESILDVTGYSDEEVASMSALEFFEGDDRETIADAVAEGFETGSMQVEADVSTKDGREIPYEFVASTLEDPDGNLVLAGIGRDITARRRYEHRLEASNERLEQFAYAASHDLQEPLRMVSSYLQLVESRYADELDEDGREFIEFAVDGADRMRDMIEGLLEYSRVETRGEPFEPVDLDEVLADVRDDLQIRIEETGADVTVGPLPRVQGDPDQLRQVFQNLLDNAMEYSGDEPPRIEVGAERCEAPGASKLSGDAAESGGEWEISVRDEGVGIDPGDVDRVFRVFERGPDADDHEGTGIGLALCRRIVERHGGDIRIDSEPGEGTTVTFTLPAASGAGE